MKARTAALEAHRATVLPTPQATAATVHPAGQTLTAWLLAAFAVVLFSGGQFGYDQGVISGALHGIKATFSLNALQLWIENDA